MKHVKVQMPLWMALAILLVPVKLKYWPFEKGLGALLFTRAKIYARGKGWYTISGYAADGSDVDEVMTRISTIRQVRRSGSENTAECAPLAQRAGLRGQHVLSITEKET